MDALASSSHVGQHHATPAFHRAHDGKISVQAEAPRTSDNVSADGILCALMCQHFSGHGLLKLRNMNVCINWKFEEQY